VIDQEQRSTPGAEVVCFGMITSAVVLAVDRPPVHNTGQFINRIQEFISDDAAIVACLLRQWDVRTALIGTAVGDDPPGRQIANRLKELGVLGNLRLSNEFATPHEVNVSDLTGARTFFWQREARVLDTLNTADLSPMAGARLLYVDWYDGDRILRPMDEAVRLGIPVFLNLEHGHQSPEVLEQYASRASICQAVTDEAQLGSDAASVAHKLLDAGADTAVVTMAGEGSLAMTRQGAIRALAPQVRVVDGCGSGAAFSAGLVHGYLHGLTLAENLRFATAAASLNCTVVGPTAFPLPQITRLASDVPTERLSARGLV
jgi:2-dehydro-3-deoxygluconokinase